ncbi:hypothetical protein [Nocardiopsis metallicus]|uniref:Uncharacterized protein n=1 Tax=Nocardiopsis metallicus TaxID=179819 RepID=A0A840WGN9_9ACTN|nr:hypothetical protein [Nocardiopsis metallicus]MBB5495234.1 hypothetical protein [Nocardiopsis metallicus]
MADTKEANSKRKEPAKKGLHGWKAALAVFGCGTLAAFGVFGVIVGVLSLVLSTASSGLSAGSDPVPVADQSIKQREEFRDDKFDLCHSTLRTISGISLIYDHGAGEYEDTSVDGGNPASNDLVRSDRCSGEVSAVDEGLVPWDFDFSYRAIIFSPDGDRDELASGDLTELRSEIEGSDLVITESGVGDLGDESYYYYGALTDNQEATYALVVKQRSATYTVRMTSPDDVPPETFAGEVRKFGPQLRITLENRIPK